MAIREQGGECDFSTGAMLSPEYRHAAPQIAFISQNVYDSHAFDD